MTSKHRDRVGIWVVAAAALSVMAAVLAAPSYALTAISVTRGSLSSGSLRVEGVGALANATIRVSSPESTASGRADSEGRFKVSASNYRSSTCKVTVADAASSVVATLSGCTPAPTPTPTPAPAPAPAPALSFVGLSHTSLSAVGTLAVGEVLLASLAGAPVTVALTSSHPGIAPVSQASVQVAAGSNQAVFTVNQTAVAPAPTIVTITAAAGGVTKTALLTINPTPVLAFAAEAITLGPAFVGTSFVDSATTGTTLGVSGRVGIVRFDIIAGQLPAGLSLLDPNNGATPGKIPAIAVSGVPTMVQTSTFTLRAIDGASGQQATTNVTITVGPPLGITVTAQLPWSPVVGSFSNLWVTGSGGVTPYTWVRIAGQLPPGMSLVQDNPDGPLVRVTGTPTTAGTDSFTLRVTDALGASTTQVFTVTVSAG